MADGLTTSQFELLNNLFWLFEDGALLSLLLGGLILLLVSRKAVDGRPIAERWGLRLGVIAFVFWYARDFITNGLWGADQFVTTGFRALLLLLYSVSVAWILLAVVSCVVQEVFGAMHRRVVTLLTTAIKSIAAVVSNRRQARKERARQAEWLREQPERERAQQEQEAKSREEKLQLHTEKQRKSDIRYEVELVYDRYRNELTDKLPPERFNEYFSDHLTSDLAVDVYAQRAEQLKSMILDRVNGKHRQQLPEFDSIESIVEHFRARKQRLQLLDLDPDTLETMEITLDDAQDRELRKLLS